MITLSLALFFVIGAGIFAELLARIYIKHFTGYHVWPPGYRLEQILDPEAFPDLPQFCRVYANSFGDRGDEPPAMGTFLNVLVAGGSAAACHYNDQSTSWAERLKQLLAEPQNLSRLAVDHVHVANIARSSVDSHKLVLQLDRAFRNRPPVDVLVIMAGASDVLLWLVDGAPARFERKSPLSDIFNWHPEHDFSWRPKRTALAECARRALYYLKGPTVRKQSAGSWMKKARRMRSAASEIRNEAPDTTFMLDHFRQNFERALVFAKLHAKLVIVARQPWFEKKEFSSEEMASFWNGGIGDVVKDEISVYYSNEVLFALLKLIDTAAAELAEKHGLEHVDLRCMIEPSDRNYYDHFHFTVAGSGAVANVLADKIANIYFRKP